MAGSPHLQTGFSDGFGSGQVKPFKSYHPFLPLRRIFSRDRREFIPLIPANLLTKRKEKKAENQQWRKV
jgi:hypothetical protein